MEATFLDGGLDTAAPPASEPPEAAPSSTTTAITSPADTLSPTATRNSDTVPPTVAGISIDDLSDSSATKA